MKNLGATPRNHPSLAPTHPSKGEALCQHTPIFTTPPGRREPQHEVRTRSAGPAAGNSRAPSGRPAALHKGTSVAPGKASAALLTRLATTTSLEGSREGPQSVVLVRAGSLPRTCEAFSLWLIPVFSSTASEPHEAGHSSS